MFENAYARAKALETDQQELPEDELALIEKQKEAHRSEEEKAEREAAAKMSVTKLQRLKRPASEQLKKIKSRLRSTKRTT